MKRISLSGVLAIGLASMLLAAPVANAAGFIQKNITCPRTGFLVIPPGQAVELSDIIISADAATDARVFFNPGNFTLLNVYLGANSSFSTNFNGQVEGEEQQGLKLTCGGTANLSITVVGTIVGFGNL